MADSQLVGLAKHCRREAAQDALLVDAAVRQHKRRSHIRRRIKLWHQIADEIDAYRAGELEVRVVDVDVDNIAAAAAMSTPPLDQPALVEVP
jgi:hypothetical protein